MSTGATIKIDGDASGFVAATEQSKKAAVGMAAALKGAIGGSTGATVKGLNGMDQEGRRACKRLNAGLINMSATITAVQAGIRGLEAGWARFSGLLKRGDDVGRVRTRLEAFTGGKSSAGEVARDVVEASDGPPFGLEETQRAAQLLLGVNVRSKDLKDTLDALGNVAAGGGMSLEQMAIRLSKAYQTGRVTMEVLEPLMNSGIDVMGALEKRTGKTRAELQKMMSTGKLGFKDLLGALISMGAAGGQFAGAMEKNTQDIDNRIEAIKGKVGALSRDFAEPVTGGLKQAMDDVGESWAGYGPGLERSLKNVGELVGDVVKGSGPIASVVGGGLAEVASGTGLVQRGIRGMVLSLGAWKVAGLVAGSSVGKSIRAAGAVLRTDYSNELRVAGGNTKRFDAAIRASGLSAKKAWRGVGSNILASLKGPAVMAAIAAITAATVELYKAHRDARGVVSKEDQDKKKNFKRDNDDFDERIWKQAAGVESKQSLHALTDEYDAEIKRLKREEEDQMSVDPLGRYTVAVQDRIVLLQQERAELLRVGEANAKAGQERERVARNALQAEEERKKTLEKVQEIQNNLLSIDYDRAEEERERHREGLGLEARKKDLLGSYGDIDGLKKAIEEQKALLGGGDAVDGVLNLEGVESKIRSLYDLLGKVEEVDREIVQRNKEWDKAEQSYRRQEAMLRAEIHGQQEKLRVLQEQARILELQAQYEGNGMSKAQAEAAAQKTVALEQNRNRAQAGREYKSQVALLAAQAAGLKKEENRLRLAERIKEIYEQQRDMGVGREEAMGRARNVAGLEALIAKKKDRKEPGGPIADSLTQVGGGGRSMMGSLPHLTEARTQTGLLRQLVRNTSKGSYTPGKVAAVLGH